MNPRAKVLIPQLAVLAAACAFLFFFGLGAIGFVGADEPRYAQVAREMFLRHDWTVPTLNGTPWLEKPALLYWKIINSYGALGVHDWAARIPSAFHATALVMAVFFFMRRFRPGSELDAALITASLAGVIGFARGASTDMLLVTYFCIALLAWWTWHETDKKVWLAVFYALLALGTLAKGPVAPALAVLVVSAYALARRDAKILFRSVWWLGLLIFFAIALPWFIAIQIKVPQFFDEFFVQHNLQRFGTNRYQHSQPFWYYLPVFLLATLPWTVFVISAILDAAKSGIRKLRTKVTDSTTGWLPVFLLLWTLVLVVFFSISHSKLPGYILPGIPAAALLAADWLHRDERSLSRVRLLLHALICGLLMAGALLASWFIVKVYPPGAVVVRAAAAGVIVSAIVLLVVRRSGLRALHFATLLPTVLALGCLLGPSASTINQVNSARAVDERLTELHAPQLPIAMFNVKRDVAYGLNFYRNRPIGYYEKEGPYDLPSGLPSGAHIVIAKEGNIGAVQAAVGDRQVFSLGTFSPQHLEFFIVSSAR
ncbi:MAG TPA: glycosyltransferase family 39 protein [Candidatus Angelobacter sp.]|nr:glycosyltransferase family 39 protein [Candidatus Angelobacter sp.]